MCKINTISNKTQTSAIQAPLAFLRFRIFSNLNKKTTFLKQKLSKFFSLVFAVYLVFTLAFITGCSKTDAQQAGSDELVISTNGKNKSKSDIEIKFNKILNPDTVNTTNIRIKDKDGKYLEKTSYATTFVDGNLIINITDPKYKNTDNEYSLEFKGVKDVNDKEVASPTKKIAVVVKDNKPPFLYGINMGQDLTINSGKVLKLTFNEPIKSDFVISLKKGNGALVANSDYSAEFTSGNTKVLEIKFLNDLKKTNQNLTIYFDKFTDKAGNQIERNFFSFKTLKFIELTLVSDNLITTGTEKIIYTKEPLELVFSKELNNDSLKSPNIILKKENSVLAENADYKVTKVANKIKIELVKDDLKKETKDYSLVIKNIKDLAGNKLKTPITKNFIFSKDAIQPRFIGSNIFGENILQGTNKIVLSFNKKLKDESASKISVKKSGTNLTASDFTASLTSNQKIVEITFNDPIISGTSYEITIPDTILDLADNKLENAQTVKVNKIMSTSEVVFVTSAGAGAKDGSSWANAYDAQTAIKQNDKTLLFAQGSYINGAAALVIKTDTTPKLKMYGGFDSNSTTDMSNTPRNFEASILEGSQTSTKLMDILGPGTASSAGEIVLDGFFFQNAKATANSYGGIGLYVEKIQDIKLDNLTFKNNINIGNDGYAGALHIKDSNATVNNAKFIGNKVTEGGAISTGNTIEPNSYKVKINNSLFINNTATNRGGAIDIRSGKTYSIEINDSTFINNSAKLGGAINNEGKVAVVIKNSNFISNNSIQEGGAIYNNGDIRPKIIDSKFILNKTSFRGGAIFNDKASPSILNSTFINNKADSHGGAVYNIYNNETKIANSLFIENKAEGNGGAMDNSSGAKPIITNSIFYKNKSNSNGGAINNYASSISKIYNSIFWDNKSVISNVVSTNNLADATDTRFEIKNSILNAGSITGNRSVINTTTDKNQTPATFVIESDGKITDATSQALIKDKGDNALYLEVYDKINGTSGTSAIPATEKDLAGNPRLNGANIDIGAYEAQ